jgi:hypothetical protein
MLSGLEPLQETINGDINRVLGSILTREHWISVQELRQELNDVLLQLLDLRMRDPRQVIHHIIVVESYLILWDHNRVRESVSSEMEQILLHSLVLMKEHWNAACLQAVEDALPRGAVARWLQTEDGFETHLDDRLRLRHAKRMSWSLRIG